MTQKETRFTLHAKARHEDGRLETIDATVFENAIKEGKTQVIGTFRAKDIAASAQYLTNQLGFDQLAVEDALSPDERPAMYEYKKYVFLVIPSLSKHNGEEEYAEIAVFLGSNFLLAVTYQDAPALDLWFKRWQHSTSHEGTALAFELHSLLDHVVDGFFPICDEIEELVDTLEDQVFENDQNIVPDALRLKRRLLSLRQRITPVRDVVNGLLRRDVRFIPKEVQPFLQDVYDHALRIAEIVDINRDIISGVLDAHLAQVSNNLNISMRILTVVATFLMTASMIAGIYGMNFKYMPELGQVWGYPFSLSLMVLFGIAEYAYFKRKRWF